jgi:hypothetical protein
LWILSLITSSSLCGLSIVSPVEKNHSVNQIRGSH